VSGIRARTSLWVVRVDLNAVASSFVDFGVFDGAN
jgi:hypothetical protein